MLLHEVLLDANASQHLATGDWCQLVHLELPCNLLDDAAMMHIAEGHWPNLRVLAVDSNPCGVLGLERLTKGRWPELRHLILDPTMFCHARLDLLNIDSVLCSLATEKLSKVVVVPRKLDIDSDQALTWPKLTKVVCWPRIDAWCSACLKSGALHDRKNLQQYPWLT